MNRLKNFSGISDTKRIACTCLTVFCTTLLAALHGFSGDFRLARELVGDGDFYGASIECRRLALESADDAEKSGYYWAAAFAAWKAGKAETADALLGRA